MSLVAVGQVESDAATGVAEGVAAQARGLTKVIDDRAILRELSFTVPSGRYVALLGHNGAGKSTLMKILATLVPASAGELRLFGQELTRDAVRVRARIGLVGHQAMLYRDLSARENLVFFGRLYGMKDARGRAEMLLEAVGLADRAGDAVKDFSRGMAQRVAIARALMHDPELLLADEPFAGLDVPSVRTLEQILTELHGAGRTIILANHDIEQSLRLAQQAIVLRRGRIVIDRPTRGLDAEAVLGEVSA
jgi:heme exporter protein A